MTDPARAATLRLFFALWPPAGLADDLAAIAGAAARRCGGRASRRENIHLTLAFLGELPAAAVPALVEAGRRIAAAPFDLRIDRLGFWRHNQLLWAGCAPSPGLDALAAQLDAALAVGRPAPDERRPAFKAHLTLARKLPPATRPADVAGFFRADLPAWPCARFTLTASRLSPAGPSYTPLAEFLLR